MQKTWIENKHQSFFLLFEASESFQSQTNDKKLFYKKLYEVEIGKRKYTSKEISSDKKYLQYFPLNFHC